MLAKGTSPIIILPIILFLLLFFTYLLIFQDWLLILLAVVFFALSALGLNFFRDPNRVIGKGLVSAADGVVSFVKKDKKKGTVTVSVFMNVHNVHVNRAPIEGMVKRTRHHPGPHAPAYKKVSDRNEQFVTDLDTYIGPVRIVQIAGTVARRIIPYIKKGDSLRKGQRIGIIRLGSRVDLVFPADMVRIRVEEGQKVLAGETSIGDLSKKAKKYMKER